MGILEVDTIKHVKMKEKNQNRRSQENEKIIRNQTKYHKRNKYLGCLHRSMIVTILQVDEKKLQQMNLKIKSKKTHDSA